MRKITLVLLILLTSIHTFAQDEHDTPPKKKTRKKGAIVRPTKCPRFYITTSTGINNNTGLVGFNFEVPVSDNITLSPGAGLSSWGYKLSLSGQYYLQAICQKGWGFGLGLTYNTGSSKFNTELETIYRTTEKVTLDLYSQTNINLTACHYWHLGKRSNRFYTQFGYSVPLSGGDKYRQIDGPPINNKSKDFVDLMSPHGIIAAVGFSFGIY